MTPDDLEAEARYRLEQARARVSELAATFAPDTPVVAEAELARRGLYPVSVAHGSADTDAAVDLIYRRLPDTATSYTSLAMTRGGGEYRTFLFTSETDAEAFLTAVQTWAPPWWTITRTATPQWT